MDLSRDTNDNKEEFNEEVMDSDFRKSDENIQYNEEEEEEEESLEQNNDESFEEAEGSDDDDKDSENDENGFIEDSILKDIDSNVEKDELEDTKKRRTRKLLKDIRKPYSKWILFSSERRKAIQKENNGLSFAEIAKQIALEYKNLPEEENLRLETQVKEDKQRYEAEMKEVEESEQTIEFAEQEAATKLNNLTTAELVFPLVRATAQYIYASLLY
jgi:hypothetical protein